MKGLKYVHFFVQFQDDFPKRCSFNASLYGNCDGDYKMIGMCGGYPMYTKIPNREYVIAKTIGGPWRCIHSSEDISSCYSQFFAKSSEVRESVEGWWQTANSGVDESYATCQ